MHNNSGITRTTVERDHALICPDSHIPLHFPEWPGCKAVVLISPEMGAKFSQLIVTMEQEGSLVPMRSDEEYFFLVLNGSISVQLPDTVLACATDDFCYLPPCDWRASTETSSEILIFSKTYIASPAIDAPAPFARCLADIAGEPFLGDPAANLQILLPDAPAFDWGINLFEFQPGGTLPQVESHFMEHGLYLLAGQGVYRLGSHWYPVEAGDTIWMGPFLPQWYAATGKAPSRYIYYKEMNRAPVRAS